MQKDKNTKSKEEAVYVMQCCGQYGCMWKKQYSAEKSVTAEPGAEERLMASSNAR